MEGVFVTIQELTLVKILVIITQKWQFRLKNESFEVSRNPAYIYIGYFGKYLN